MAKVLVIEDEEVLRGEVVEWLTLEGHEAIGAPDGLAGLEGAQRHLPDLIVCDITMPHLDGFGVLLELNSSPATIGIPFIFVTLRPQSKSLRNEAEFGTVC
jgi:CheY-like chemotaxis protein